MKTLSEIAAALRTRTTSVRLTQDVLRERCGISRRTLTHVLSGQQDFKITTLLAIADALGLEMVLVPKAAAAGLGRSDDATPAPLSRIQVAQAEVGARIVAATRRPRKARG